MADVVSTALRGPYSATSRHTPRRLLLHITDIVTSCASPDLWPAFQLCKPCAFHGCRILTCFLAELQAFIEYAPSLIVNSVTRAVGDDIHLAILVGNLSNHLNQSVGDDHAWKHSLLQVQSDTFIVGLLVVSAARRPKPLCATQRCTSPLVLHSCNQAFRHVDYLFLTTCSATMFAVYLMSDPNGPPTAFLLFRSQCTVGVLAGTHWSALGCPGKMASGTKRRPLSAALLQC